MSDEHLIEHQVHSEELLRGHFLHAFRDTVRLPNQGLATREYVVHPGAVMIIPMLETPEGLQLVMERQYRYPVAQVMIEFPAGKLDPGEDPWLCAQRELLEETGYSARQWARAGVLHPVIAYSTEVIEIWFAKDLSLGERQLDAEEFLDVFTASPQDLMAACQQGLLTDAKTLTGLLWLQNVTSGFWPLTWQPCLETPSP
ncbi:ADP-ribose pyrophosphatase [Limnohabitans sp. 2KL-1]|uniref:NUDIX domain-containing protein n=1 Tax=Limnohabitans sp. 2KL-1 TaxID=1100699 RepID=UPI000D33ED09|nr:NUDIX hydrolase [Limnohabitans sp. 2KL-1]PUE46086.1 ADP-ribose pyrophosphatase [Limnohabitans sp. 2KL-1]